MSRFRDAGAFIIHCQRNISSEFQFWKKIFHKINKNLMKMKDLPLLLTNQVSYNSFPILLIRYFIYCCQWFYCLFAAKKNLGSSLLLLFQRKLHNALYGNNNTFLKKMCLCEPKNCRNYFCGNLFFITAQMSNVNV